jgi:tetratricopeptide (TPR) repeat protein
MSPHALTLATAIDLHRTGRLQEAEALYRQVLASEPDNPQALHMLGVIALQVGRPDLAIGNIEAALRRGPDGEMYANLGGGYLSLGRVTDAQACLEQAVKMRPNLSSAHHNLGNVYRQLGRFADAVACYRRALQLQPDDSNTQLNLAVALTRHGDVPAAVTILEKLAKAHPKDVAVRVNLGLARQAQGRLGEAVLCFRKAAELRPDLAEPHYNLGNAYKLEGRYPESAVSLRRALELMPHDADTHFSLGMTLLMLGEWREGWREYDWRWRTRDFKVPGFTSPPWDGSDLAGRTIVVYAEQGLGDTLQFARYAPMVQQRGGNVVLRCQTPLAPLFAGVAGVQRVSPRSEPLPECDCHMPLLGLPSLFGTTPETVPANVPYLHADPQRRARWRDWLDQHPGRKIGICWQGGQGQVKDDALRSMKLSTLAPLAGVPDVQLVSLQVGGGREQLTEQAERMTVLDPALEPDEAGETFQEVAALMCELERVVTIDTALAHLAGALGVPTWLALRRFPDWRWLQGREDTPWYPTMRLFRQEQVGKWDPVVARLAGALHVAANPPSPV